MRPFLDKKRISFYREIESKAENICLIEFFSMFKTGLYVICVYMFTCLHVYMFTCLRILHVFAWWRVRLLAYLHVCMFACVHVFMFSFRMFSHLPGYVLYALFHARFCALLNSDGERPAQGPPLRL